MATPPAREAEREAELLGAAAWVLQGTGRWKLRLTCVASQQAFRQLGTHHAALLLAGIHPADADGGHAHSSCHLHNKLSSDAICTADAERMFDTAAASCHCGEHALDWLKKLCGVHCQSLSQPHLRCP